MCGAQRWGLAYGATYIDTVMPPSGAFSPQYTSSLLLTNILLLGGSLAAVVPTCARHLCDLFCCAQPARVAPSDALRLHRARPYDNIRPHAKRQGGAGSVGLTLAPACLGNREGAGSRIENLQQAGKMEGAARQEEELNALPYLLRAALAPGR